MEIISDWKAIPEALRHCACALGTFDGLHRGHQTVIRTAVDYAQAHGLPSVVFTFANHPRSVLSPEKAPLVIESEAVRRLQLEQMGVDALFEPVFTTELAAMDPLTFLEFLQEKLAPVFVTAGPNYSFGKFGAGRSEMLSEQGDNFGFTAQICPTVDEEGQMISSTRIREFIVRGKLSKANTWLGHPVSVYGEVMHGDKRGRLLGFPTANIALPKQMAVLPKGVYATRVTVEGEIYAGAANIGNNPTFGIMETRLEVHLLHFTGDLYGKNILVEFLARLRGEEKFPSVDALIAQMEKDKAEAERIFLLE